MTPTLSYDDLPPGSDLSREFRDDGVTFTAAVRDPSARAIRAARRKAARRAAIDAALALALFTLIAMLLVRQLGRRPNLPPIVFPLGGIIGAGFFLLAWQVRSSEQIDALDRSRKQVTVITADADALRVETEGPFGAQSHCLPAAEVCELRAVNVPEKAWFATDQSFFRITLRDGRTIDVLPGRDEAELRCVAALLRRVLRVPQTVDRV